MTPQQQAIINVALAQLGKPYEWDGKGPNSFDCSGLVSWAWKYGVGITLPAGTVGELTVGTEVAGQNVPFSSIEHLLEPCDLIFPWSGHVQIWTGTDIIEALESGVPVHRVPEWSSTVYQVRRMPLGAAPDAPGFPGQYLELKNPYMTSSEVGEWQSRLNALKVAALAVDNEFGPNTEAATKKFQTSKKLTVDGIVGPQTWAAAWA